MKAIMLVVLLSLLISCESIKFEKDITFTPSALANSPEYSVKLNGKLCKDVEGKQGFCAIRVKDTDNLIITIEPQPYAYNFSLDCTNSIGSDDKYNWDKDKELKHTIPYRSYNGARYFNCSITIQPMDRDEPVAAKASWRVCVVDAHYSRLQRPIHNGEYLILGKYAYHSKVWEDDGIKFYKKKTVIKTKSTRACVESYQARINCSE